MQKHRRHELLGGFCAENQTRGQLHNRSGGTSSAKKYCMQVGVIPQTIVASRYPPVFVLQKNRWLKLRKGADH